VSSDWRGRPPVADLGPWSARDVTRLLSISGAGVIGASVCWSQGAHKLTYPDQVPWLIGSIASTGLIVLALAHWLLLGFRHVRLEANDVFLQLLREIGPLPAARVPLRSEATPADPLSEQVMVTASGMSRYHAAGCPLAQGKPGLRELTGAEIVRDKLDRCGVCLR
jgi:hypothetical protein